APRAPLHRLAGFAIPADQARRAGTGPGVRCAPPPDTTPPQRVRAHETRVARASREKRGASRRPAPPTDAQARLRPDRSLHVPPARTSSTRRAPTAAALAARCHPPPPEL